MRMSFDIQMTGLKIQENKVNDKAKKVLWLSMHKMEELAKRFAPVDTGLLRRSINLHPISEGSKEYTLADGVFHGEYLEYGTSPHQVPIHPLKVWAKRVLGDESLAYAVRNKIAVKGTAAHPFFRPSLLEVQTVWLKVYWKQVIGEA